MARTSVRVNDAELALLRKLREGTLTLEQAQIDVEAQVAPTAPANVYKELSDAFVEAIERTKPAAKITVANRKAKTPWTPPAGEAVVKLRRKYFHHSLQIEDKLSNEEKALLNQIKPGRYCDGHVSVKLRKDGGLDIDYPVRTNVQRLLLVNRFGIRSFSELLQRIIDEKAYPAKYRKPEDRDLYDLDE